MATRLTVGNDGIVLGAGAIAHDAVTDRAVLLLHGFGDTPQTLHYVADALFAAGYTVRAPLLPGHGRTLAEFGTSLNRATLTQFIFVVLSFSNLQITGKHSLK